MHALHNSSGVMSFLTELLHRADPGIVPVDHLSEYVSRGAVTVLEELAEDESCGEQAVQLLYDTVVQHPNTEVRNLAYRVLIRLCEIGNNHAINQMYVLSIEKDHLAARQAIMSNGWTTIKPELDALFEWFTLLQSKTPYPEAKLPQITKAFFNFASSELRSRLILTADSVKMENWGRIVTKIETNSTDSISELVEQFPMLSPQERQLCIDLLLHKANLGSQIAIDAICQLFIYHDSQPAKQIAMDYRFFPEDMEKQAVFFFLSEQWDNYHKIDFNSNLLKNFYETAGRALRRRILEHSRNSGQIDWLHGTGLAGDSRWVGDLTDADWDLAVKRLLENGQLKDLWQLAQFAPPVWSAHIINRLSSTNWQPDNEEERAGLTNLFRLANACLHDPLTIRAKKKLHPNLDYITCLTIAPDGSKLAAGSSDQRIIIWDLPEGKPNDLTIIGPVPMTRALLFSPDNEFLISAAKDHRLRIFGLHGGQIQKTIVGHTAMVRSLLVTPDSRVLISAGYDGQIHYWRFPYGNELKTIKSGPSEILALALGLDGKHLLSAGIDGKISVWSVPDGTATRQIDAHIGSVTHLASSINSEFAVSVGHDGCFRQWNIASGRLIRTWANIDSPVTSLQIHPSNLAVASGHQNGSIILWNLSNGKQVDQLAVHKHPVNGLVFSPDGNTIYSSDTSGFIQSWNMQYFLTMHIPGIMSRPGITAELQDKIKRRNLSQVERTWLLFAAELARWHQRYEIEVSDIIPIQTGEFDIELI